MLTPPPIGRARQCVVTTFDGACRLKVVVVFIIIVVPSVHILVSRVRPALLLALDLVLQRRDVVLEALLLRHVEEVDFLELAVEGGDEERVGGAGVAGADERGVLVRFEVVVRILKTAAVLVLLELVYLLLQCLVAVHGHRVDERRYGDAEA